MRRCKGHNDWGKGAAAQSRRLARTIQLQHTSAPKRCGSRRGFTLLELLVVIFIITVLASLTLATLSRAKDKGRAVYCLNNARQIGLSYLVRLRDANGDHLDGPEALDWQVQDTGRRELGWICPEAPAVVETPWINSGNLLRGTVRTAWEDPGWLQDGGDRPLYGPNLRVGSYSVNDHLLMASRYNRWPLSFDGLDPHVFTMETEVTRPELTPVVGDGVHPRILAHATDFAPTDFSSGDFAFGMGLMALPRHGERPASFPRLWPRNVLLPGAVNVSFFDGHAQAIKVERLWQLYWHKQYKAPLIRPGLP